MAEVLLFHHALGLTPGCLAFADRLRAAGHVVHAPDLYDGRTFPTVEAGVDHARSLGFGTVLEKGRHEADDLPEGLVYLGFSLGVMPAQLLAQTRPGALGALLVYSCLPVSEFGETWPEGVPVQVHGMDADPSFADEGDLEAAQALVQSTGDAELFLYPGSAHLFADESVDDHDPAAAALLEKRVLAFLSTGSGSALGGGRQDVVKIWLSGTRSPHVQVGWPPCRHRLVPPSPDSPAAAPQGDADVAAGGLVKRLLVGRALRSDRQSEQELPKHLALPIFASDPLSSVTYATQELLVVLTLGGLAYLYLTPYLAAGVVALLTVVVLSYRQVVRAYPSGGGDYEVASVNLGKRAGRVVASALLVDYVLTVAVSVSAGVDNIISAAEGLAEHRVALALGFVVFLTAMNLRGVKESGKAFAVPTYGFVLGVATMIGYGLYQVLTGEAPQAESAAYAVLPDEGKDDLTGLAFLFLALRAFASGCTALTGVEAIANGVPAFRRPKSKNAATTLALMGGTAMTMFVGITALAILTDVRYSEHPAEQFVGFEEGDVQRSVIAQVAAAVFGDGTAGFFYLQVMAAGILILAANTAYNGFPLLGSILAQDRNLPRQLLTRGDRLVYSNGVLLLAVFAGLLIIAFEASVTRLIQLYIIGVFTSFTLGQAGMVRHWNRLLASGTVLAERRRSVRRSRAINALGASLTGLVLVIVTITKFTHGAYLVLIAMPVLYAVMRGIARHYEQIAVELEPADEVVPLPSRNHALVLVSKLHAPTLRALAYARATRPHSLTALTVSVDAEETHVLQQEWDRRGVTVPLTILDSPYREITRPVLDHVRALRLASPRDVVTVFIPEYVVGRWWEQLLHNQSALRLKSRLLFQPGVMVTSVAYQLRSSTDVRQDDEDAAPGAARRPSR